MNDSDPSDGGPAFPVQDASAWQAHGMSKRELFAAILMHGELVTGGPNGENASRAVAGADELLIALGAPQPTQYRQLYTSEQMQIDAAGRLASTVTAMQECPEYAALPPGLRAQIERDLSDVNDPEIPF